MVNDSGADRALVSDQAAARLAPAGFDHGERFTPGPWRFEAHRDPQHFYGNVVGSYGLNAQGIEQIRTITCQTTYGEPAEREANAHLIAAAPDLYRVLTEVRDWIRYELEAGTPNATVKLRSVIAALTKARGEAA